MVPAEACPDCYDEDVKAFGWNGPAVVISLSHSGPGYP
jgi:RNA polymerase subunit RPABC4/transcription elongation factor Spt4